MGGAFWSAVTHGRYYEQKRLSSSHSPERAFRTAPIVAKALPDHRPPRSMPPAKATGKERAGARQDSEPAPYSHHLCNVLINPCVRHSYFIMWRARVTCAGKAPTSEIKKNKGKAKSPVTGQEEGPRVTRPARPWPGAWPSRQEAPSTRSSPTLASRPMVQAMSLRPSCAVLCIIPASLGALRPGPRSSRTLPSPCASKTPSGPAESSQEVVPPAMGGAARSFLPRPYPLDTDH